MAPAAAPLIDPTVATALASLTATLSLKIGVTHLLSARCRLMTKTFDTWSNGGNDITVTTGMLPMVLGAFGPTFGGKAFLECVPPRTL